MKTLLISLLVAFSSLAHAASGPMPLDSQFVLNRGTPAQVKAQLGSQVTVWKKHVLKASYDFAKQGGAIGAISLLGENGLAAELPGKAIVTGCFIDVLTSPTSSGLATIALGTGQSTTDLKAATAIASYTGIVACVPVGTAVTAVKLTQAKSAVVVPKATVAAFALTAGKFNVLIEYLLSD